MQSVRRSFVDQQPLANPLLQLPIKLLRGPTAALAVFNLGFRLSRVIAFDLHQRAESAFEPVAFRAGESCFSFTQSIEGQQLEFGWSKEFRMSGQHDAQQRRS